MSAEGVDALFRQFDGDGRGTIDFKELNKLVRQGTATQLDDALLPGASGKIELMATCRMRDGQPCSCASVVPARKVHAAYARTTKS